MKLLEIALKSISEGKDAFGQQYLTPHRVIAENGSDVMIFGRDIIDSFSPLESARQYRSLGWEAYCMRM